MKHVLAILAVACMPLARPSHAFSPATEPSGDWLAEIIKEGALCVSRTLAIDSTARLIVAGGGYYTKQQGQSWHAEDLPPGQRGESYSFCWTADALPAIVIGQDRSIPFWTLALYTMVEGTWQYEEITAPGVLSGRVSVACDSLNRLQVAFHETSAKDLMLAIRDDAGWQFETILADGDVGDYPCIALDALDRPHISFYDATDGALMYAHHDGSNWLIETIDSDGNTGLETSLALDSAGRPHIAYYAGGPNCNLRFVSRDEGGWHTETVDDEGNVGRYPSLRLDSTDVPHVTYYDLTHGDLKYGCKIDGGWAIQRVDTDGIVGLHCSLTLDASDRPHVSYCDLTRGTLKYAYYDQPPFRVRLSMPGTYFAPGDDCGLEAGLSNNTDQPASTQMVAVLQVGWDFWFWPSWAAEVDGKHLVVPPGESAIVLIESFTWPDTGPLTGDALVFWSALMDEEYSSVLGGARGISDWWFGFGPRKGCKR